MPGPVQKPQTLASNNNDFLKSFGKGVTSSLGCIAIGNVLGCSLLPVGLISGVGIGYLMRNPHSSLENRQTEQLFYRIGLGLVAASSISSYATVAITLSFLGLSNFSSQISVDTFFSKDSKMHSFVDNAMEYASFLSNLFNLEKVKKMNELKKKKAQRRVTFLNPDEQNQPTQQIQKQNRTNQPSPISRSQVSTTTDKLRHTSQLRQASRQSNPTRYAERQQVDLESKTQSHNNSDWVVVNNSDSIYEPF